MPLLGNRGTVAPRTISKATARPAPPARSLPVTVPRPVPRPAPSVFTTHLPTQPFAPAQHEAARAVAHALARQPKIPVPNIPRLPNPTPGQAHAALTMAAEAQRRYVGPNPTAARIRAYQQEIAADPRLRDYRETVAHYARAAEGHLAAQEGRRALSGSPTVAQTPSGAGDALSRAAQVAVGRAQWAARAPYRSQILPRPGPSSVTLPLANIKIPTGQISATIGHALASVAPGLAGNTPETKFARNALGDVKAIGELPLLGAYQIGGAAVGAAQGNLQPAKQLASGVLQGLEHGALGEAVQGHLGGAARAFNEHPVFSLLEATGEAGVAGRSAGALARGLGSTVDAAGVRGALARTGSRVRPAIALTEDAGAARRNVKQRTYSGDLIRKAAQVAADKRRAPVLDARGRPVTIKDRGRVVPVLKAHSSDEIERLSHREANYRSRRTQDVENRNRQLALKQVIEAASRSGHGHRGAIGGKAIPAGRSGYSVGTLAEHLAVLAATGTIRTAASLPHDLAKRIAVIKDALQNHAGGYRTEVEKATAEANLKMLQAAQHPKVLAQAKNIVRAGERAAAALNHADRKLVERQVGPAAQIERSQLTEYALAHMGATHDGERIARAAPSRQELEAFARAKLLAQHAPVVEKIQKLRALAGRAGTPAEALAAGKKAGRLEHGLGFIDYRHIPSVRQAAADLRHHEALRAADGKPLTNEEIRGHALLHGRNPDTLAYLPHRVNAEDKRSYHRSFRPGSRPGGLGTEARTGALFSRGANIIHSQLITDELTKKLTLHGRTAEIDQFAKETGIRHPALEKSPASRTAHEQKVVQKQHGYFTPAEGAEWATRLHDDGKGEFIPIRAFGAGLSAQAKDQLRSELSPSAMESVHHRLLNDRIVDGGHPNQTANVVLAPKEQVDKLLEQLSPAGPGQRWVRLLNRSFRMAVLPQPRWLTGNFVEPYLLRLPLSGSGINLPGLAMDLKAGRAMYRTMAASSDPAVKQAGEQFRAMHGHGLFLGGKGSVRQTYQDFNGRSRKVLKVGHDLRHLPAVKQLGDLALLMPKAFFEFNKRVIENPAQLAVFGKEVRRDIQAATGSWVKSVTLSKQALEDAANGLINTPAQHRFAEAEYERLGQYAGFNPTMRRLQQGLMPFLPWTLASLRFVFWTLPAHHTVAFEGLMKAGQAVQNQWEEDHADVPPGTLRAAIKAPDGGLVDLARYFPFGVTQPLSELGNKGVSANSATEGLTNTLLPQLSGALGALGGKDPFGRELQVSGGQKPTGTQELGIAANQLFEGTVPGVAIARRLMEHGGTAYGNSSIFSPQTKPGTSHQGAVNRTLNPFRETYLKAPAGGVAASDPVERAIVQQAEQEADHHAADPVTQELIRQAEEEADRRASGH